MESTEAEVKRMMDESLEHAFADMADREEVELRNKARAMVEGTKKALALADLPPDQTWTIKKLVKQLAKQIDDTEESTETIRATVDELSELTGQVADDVISSAVNKSLRDSPPGTNTPQDDTP